MAELNEKPESCVRPAIEIGRLAPLAMDSFRAAWSRIAGRGLSVAGISGAGILTQNRAMLRAVTPDTR